MLLSESSVFNKQKTLNMCRYINYGIYAYKSTNNKKVNN